MSYYNIDINKHNTKNNIPNNIVTLVKNNSTPEEIIKLSENFMNFSRGFEGITVTLNKNFADFKQKASKLHKI